MSSDDPQLPPDLAALIGSRICHDLISPIGAIGNGLELLNMSGIDGPEFALIAESVGQASAKIRFFRIALGMASADQGAARAQILAILQDMYPKDGRTRVNWAVQNDCRRSEAKAAFLALMCIECALPYGGEIEITRNNGNWHLAGRNSKLKFEPQLWNAILGGEIPELAPKHVQFGLLARALKQLGRRAALEHTDTSITLGF